MQHETRGGGGQRPYPLAFALLLVAYTLLALGGLRWSTIADAASPIWPAAGVAFAGLVIGGRRLVPAIALGLFIATQLFGVSHPWWSQLLMALGNAGGAWAGASLAVWLGNRRFTRLATVRDVLILLAAAGVSALVSATTGMAALLAAGRVGVGGMPDAALQWFFGDAVGILIIAPVLLTFAGWRRDARLLDGWQPLHLAGALLATAALSVLVFFTAPLARAWAVYPALCWVALAFRTPGATLGLVIVGMLASGGTVMDLGPFSPAGGGPDILLLQMFLMVTGGTTLLLAAAVEESRAESRLRQAAADELAARRELQRTTLLLNLIGDAAPSFIYAKDGEGRMIYANRALLELYDRPADEVLGRTDFEFNPAAEAAVFRANDLKVMNSGEPTEVEEELTVAGGVRTYLSVKAPLRDADGTITGIVGISTDITDRRQQQAEFERLARRAEIAQRAARSSLYEYDVATDRVVRDPLLAQLCGLDPADLTPDPEAWEKVIHPADLPSFRSTVAAALDRFERFALEYRVLGRDGQVTWVSDAGTILRDADGQVRQVVGLVTDVTLQKHSDERERLLAREVDHRAKNLLAVVQSVVQLTRAENGEQLKAGITGRIQSLARAHSLLAEARWEGVELTALAREEMAPFSEEHDESVTLHGPALLLKPAAAQSIALVLHELATNAAKYGALSAPDGRVEVSWCIERDGGLLLVWQERGGPPGTGQAPVRSGFGSRLIKASIERQLRGTLAYDWAEAGLTVTLTVAPDYVALADREAGAEPVPRP